MSNPISKEASECANQTIELLDRRKGFDSWWHDIDGDIKSGILERISAVAQSAIDAHEKAKWRPVSEIPTQNGIFKHYLACSPFATIGVAMYDTANKKWMFEGKDVCFWRELPELPTAFD